MFKPDVVTVWKPILPVFTTGGSAVKMSRRMGWGIKPTEIYVGLVRELQ